MIKLIIFIAGFVIGQERKSRLKDNARLIGKPEEMRI